MRLYTAIVSLESSRQMGNLAMSIKKFCFQRFCFRCPWCSFPFVRMCYKPQHARIEHILQQWIPGALTGIMPCG